MATYPVAVNVAALEKADPAGVEVVLPDGRHYRGEPVQIEQRGPGSLLWKGRLVGDGMEGEAILTVHHGHIAGRLTLPDGLFELRPDVEGPGLATLIELDDDLFPECGGAIEPPATSRARAVPPRVGGGEPSIDVLVVYTPNARDASGGEAQIQALIQNAVDVTNASYESSNVSQRLVLAHMTEVLYDETGQSGSEQLTWLRTDPSVANLRDAHYADMVSLVSALSGLCGIAYVMRDVDPSFEAWTFSVNDWDCAVGNLSFAHELGHNMGLEHDPANGTDPGSASYPWSFGHFVNGAFRTVMAYSWECPSGCVRVGHFSNPDVTYAGSPTGIAGERDNARTLDLTAPIVAAFRPGRPDLSFSTSSLDFGDVELGSTSPIQPAVLQNVGASTASDLTFEPLDSGFESYTDNCGTALAPGESCEIDLTFTPTTAEPATAILEAHSDDGSTAVLTMDGNGVNESEVFTPMGINVDASPVLSDGNGVFEPGERIAAAPAWRNGGAFNQVLYGTALNFRGPEGAAYLLSRADAEYGEVEPQDVATCIDTTACYSMGVNAPATRPTQHWDAAFDEALSDSSNRTWTLHIGESFVDVPRESPFYVAVETLLHAGVTGGCTGSEYCPVGRNTRGQMAVFLLKAAEGGDYTPPACTEGAELFTDVPFDSVLCPWIEELAGRQITAGCDGGNYCPGDSVTRAQMAVFLLRAAEGGGYTPPACTGEFSDVQCPSAFASWVEELSNRGVTGGCSAQPPAYCPTAPVTRAQMAAFVASTFGLTLYGP